MADHSTMRLGRRAVKHDAARRRAAGIYLSTLPKPPASVDQSRGLKRWGMMRNDELGDCTIAGLAHNVQVVTAATGGILTPGDAEVVRGYERFCGYNPNDPDSDQGGIEGEILPAVMREGFVGQKLLNFVSPDPGDLYAIKRAIAHFGAVYMGANLPLIARSQNVWQLTRNDGGEWGGHCMIAIGYDHDTITFVSWGELKRATWAWWLRYVDEAHVLLWDAWLKMFPVAQAEKYLKRMQEILG